MSHQLSTLQGTHILLEEQHRTPSPPLPHRRTACGPPKIALQVSGFDEAEGSVTLNATVSVISEELWGRWVRLSLNMKSP